ncbi:MAG: prephenate dehydrogenase/arogenate dehydrogenase family protein [Proteobacteria bacterium]|nr:prephenate dehydrogenase/arogenate dehydrogenase family protein [Pseudomonadota bacterium]
MMKKIGIIGGTGQMGQMFERYFKAHGKEVLISDEYSKPKEKKLVTQSDVIIVSVPIHESVNVIRRIKPWLRRDQLLSDFCSVKSKIIPVMAECEASIISCHPMFGPMPEIAKQNIILLPVRADKFLSKYKRMYQELDLNVVVMDDWKKHDESMSFIQGLMHFFHIVFTQTLKSKHVDLSTLLSICSPVYQANFAFTCRILQRDPGLYTHILMDNPENINVLKNFIQQAQESLKLIQKKDESAFKERFIENREYLGEFGKIFSSQSDFLVEKMKEYST